MHCSDVTQWLPGHLKSSPIKVLSEYYLLRARGQRLSVALIDHALLQVPVFEMGVDVKPAEIANQGLAKARAEGYDAIIVDTAGRLQVCAWPPNLAPVLHQAPVCPFQAIGP